MNERRSFLPLAPLQPRYRGSERVEGRIRKLLTVVAVRLFLLAIGIFPYSGVFAQTFNWAKQTGGSDHDSGNSIVLDAWGNVYITGSFQDTVDFDPGPGIAEVKANGMADVFVQKLDSSGKFIWAKHVGGPSSDHGRTIVTDKAGNTYTIGSFRGSVDFDPGTETAHLTAAGEEDIFILKLDKSGNYIWAKRMGGPGSEIGFSLTIDSAGNLYSTGYFSDTADFDPGPGVVRLTSRGGHEIYINKLDDSGNFKWAKSMGSTNDDWGISIFADADGNVYTTGHFDLTVDFNPAGSTGPLTSFGDADVFVLKLDSSGHFKWIQQMGGNSHDQGRAIVVDAQKNVYITGSFETAADFDPGPGVFPVVSEGSRDIYVQKLDSSGKNLWVATIGGTQFMRGNSIAVDLSGNVYTTGRFKGTADFDPGPEASHFTSKGNDEYFIQKLDPGGQLVWALVMGAHLTDHGHCIAVDAESTIYTTGTFQGTVDFDPGTGSFNLEGAGRNDMFVHKITQ